MFTEACTAAAKFTRPVVTSVRTLADEVSSGPSAFMILNDEGWALAAAHAFDEYQLFKQHATAVADYESQMQTALAEPDPNRRRSKVKRIKPDRTLRRNVSM